MQGEYQAILSPILKEHRLRQAVIMTVLVISLVFANGLYCDQSSSYQTDDGIMYGQLHSELQKSVNILTNIYEVTSQVLHANITGTPPLAALSSICYDQASCSNLTQNLNNSLIRNTYTTTTGLACLNGTCQQLLALADYYWLFTVRNQIIAAIYLEYSDRKGVFNQVMVPVSAYTSVQFSARQSGLGLLFSSNGNWYLSSPSNRHSTLQVYLQIDPDYIQETLHISLSKIVINPADSSPYKNITSREGSLICGFAGETQSVRADWIGYQMIWVVVLLLALVRLVYTGESIIHEWSQNNFRRLLTLENVYKQELNQIFSGHKPSNSAVLENGAISQFYQHMSQIPDKQFQAMAGRVQQPQKLQNFRYEDVIKQLLIKFQEYSRPIFIEKNREIVNNKVFIANSVNDISETSGKKLKLLLVKAKQLRIVSLFFKYGYCALLLPTIDYDTLVAEDEQPLPDGFLNLFRQINRTVKSADIVRAFKLSENLGKETEEELQIRVQDSLIKKYLQIFRELDVEGVYAKQLGLERELAYLNDNVENLKYLLTSLHNKNIRIFGK